MVEADFVMGVAELGNSGREMHLLSCGITQRGEPGATPMDLEHETNIG